MAMLYRGRSHKSPYLAEDEALFLCTVCGTLWSMPLLDSCPNCSKAKEKKMAANDIQHGGDHYHQEDGEQHWDRVWRLYGRGYFVGNITKYVERYHLKNGIEDLKKAQHYIQKLIELEEAESAKIADPLQSQEMPVLMECVQQPSKHNPVIGHPNHNVSLGAK